MLIFLFSVLAIFCLWYRCYREREGKEAGQVTGDSKGWAGDNIFAAPAGVPEEVSTLMDLVNHYYFRSMYSLVTATARRWFPTVLSLEDGPVQEIELDVV